MEQIRLPVEVLCERASPGGDPRVPGAIRTRAGCCGYDVWLSPSSFDLDGRVRCLPCAGLPPRLDPASLCDLAAFREGMIRTAPGALSDIRFATSARAAGRAAELLADFGIFPLPR